VTTSAIDFIPILCALISVAAAVAAAFIVRRGSDSALKGDVNELAAMVERLTKEARRDKMRRVRAGQKDTDPESFPVPPGAEQIPEQVTVFDKAAIRRQMALRRFP